LGSIDGTNSFSHSMKIVILSLSLFSLFSFKKQEQNDFLMIVDDTFTLSGGVLVVTGQIRTGNISVGDTIIFSYKEDVYELKVEFMEIFGKPAGTKTAYAQQHLGIHVSGVPKYYFHHGQELKKK
jgi:elongation factor Tu